MTDLGQAVRQRDLRSLFIEHLGWDRHRETVHVAVDGYDHELRAVAESHDVQIESLHSSASELHAASQRHDKEIENLLIGSRQDGEPDAETVEGS